MAEVAVAVAVVVAAAARHLRRLPFAQLGDLERRRPPLEPQLRHAQRRLRLRELGEVGHAAVVLAGRRDRLVDVVGDGGALRRRLDQRAVRAHLVGVGDGGDQGALVGVARVGGGELGDEGLALLRVGGGVARRLGRALRVLLELLRLRLRRGGRRTGVRWR